MSLSHLSIGAGVVRSWEPIELAAERLRPWLPEAICARHQAGLGDFLTELRRVVALFLGARGELERLITKVRTAALT